MLLSAQVGTKPAIEMLTYEGALQSKQVTQLVGLPMPHIPFNRVALPCALCTCHGGIRCTALGKYLDETIIWV
jgi:hypothetical protein